MMNLMEFNIIKMGEIDFRCVLNDILYFDFTISQYELFGYNSFFKILQDCAGKQVYSGVEKKAIGEVISVRYIKQFGEIWLLIRNGIRGEFYRKVIGDSYGI